ncbi:MAG: uroporphyrinogen-III synthase [Sphingomonadales bacterium]|nr:uroporphyrinogen-III synthase [Sphingomonadales bacterium]
MSVPLIVIRPEPGCAATLAAATARGIEAWGFPLHDLAPTPWLPPAPDDFDALLIGSANVVRHAGAALALYRALPAYVVGERTAATVRDAGLTVAGVGGDGLQSALALLAPGHRRLLRLAGRERIDLVPPDGVTITAREVYASRPLPMPPELARLLNVAAIPRFVVALHSGEAARHFSAECNRLGIARARIAIVAIGPRVAGMAGDGWAGCHVAAQATDAALLALAGQLCQTNGGMAKG